MLWVSITGAAQLSVTSADPGREIIGFPLTQSTNPNAPDTLGAPVTFGGASTPAASPFVCPGGLFAQATGAVHLWINDSGYADSTKPPTCGGAGDIAPETGGVFAYTVTQLGAHTAQVPTYLNVTGRPGPARAASSSKTINRGSFLSGRVLARRERGVGVLRLR